MPTMDECRRKAEECLRWADEAANDRQRETLLEIARLWTQMELSSAEPNGVDGAAQVSRFSEAQSRSAGPGSERRAWPWVQRPDHAAHRLMEPNIPSSFTTPVSVTARARGVTRSFESREAPLKSEVSRGGRPQICSGVVSSARLHRTAHNACRREPRRFLTSDTSRSRPPTAK